MKKTILIILSSFLILGCGPRFIVKSDPSDANIIKDFYAIKISPMAFDQIFGSYTAFYLFIENKTNKDIEIIWDKTAYIKYDNTNGGFMFEGIVYKDRNNPKPPDIIFPNSTFSKSIWPNNLVGFYRGWYHGGMPMGNNGIYLTMKIDNIEFKEKITFNLYQEQLK
jgi:hypothetical protein